MDAELKIQLHSFEEIEVGHAASIEVYLSKAAVFQFADLTGDHNPLHVDEDYARSTQFEKNICHGMLVSSYVSTLVGMILPGKRCLVLSSSFDYLLPVFHSDIVVVAGLVKEKTPSQHSLGIDVKIFREIDTVIDGYVRVKVLDEH